MSPPTQSSRPGIHRGNMGGMIALLIKGAKIFKSTKVLLAAGSFATYSFLFSWQFSAVLIVTLVFHEYGHLWAMKRYGMKTKGIYLIPFVGGAAVSEEAFRSRWEEVYVAAMGPSFGLALCLAFLGGYAVTGLDILALMAAYGALVNAFNLLPISPLDGGRIMKCLAFSASHSWGFALFVVGALIGVWGLFVAKVWLFGFILLISILDFWGEWRRHRAKKSIEELRPYFHFLCQIGPHVEQADTLDELVARVPEEVAEYLQQFPDLQTARMHIESETQKIGEVIDLLEGAMLTPDLSLGEVICSVVWYLALAVGLFGTMLVVYYLGVPGADLPALIISGAE